MDKTMEMVILAQEGDDYAKETLVKENSGLIWSVVRRFKGRGYDLEDLYQIGAMGFLKAIYKFDLTFEVRLSTYAVPMIIGEIKRFLRDDGLIKVSRTLKETSTKAKYIGEEIRNQKGEEPTVKELAQAVGVSSEELIMAMEASKDVESIYSTVYQSDGNPVYLIDKLKMDDDDDNMVNLIALRQAIVGLDDKERDIIRLRYFEDKTQTEVARVVGISQVQVSRLEKKVLGRIREKIM